MAANTTYGVYVLFHSSPNALAYSNIPGRTTVSDAYMTLAFGIGKAEAFGTSFNNREFNGAIYYDVAAVPEPANWLMSGLVGLGAVGFMLHHRRARSAGVPAR